MKKVILLTIFFSSIFINDSVFSGEVPKSFTEKTGYDLYKEQVQNYCTDYKKTNLKNELIFVLDEAKYFKDLEKNKPEVWKDLEKARQEYEKNMDSIYGCATYSSYYRSLKTIKEDLIKKNPKLSARLKAKLDHKMKEIEKKIKKLDWKCKINSNKNNLVKNAVLRQVTYETCKYNYYLEYLKFYNQKIENLVDTEKNKKVQIEEITKKSKAKIEDINNEIERTYRTFTIAFQAYNDYENHISNHILLELLKEDYKVFRLWLHKTLNPINQVIYKISNATRR